MIIMNNDHRIKGGLRTVGIHKESTADAPLITVVTVVYNNVDSLEKTILSIINQSYKNVEYIIIDGGSTDGTVDLIRKYDDRIDYWISEPDKGLFYAMNKGLFLAKGVWINFMNSGDSFCNTSTIEEVFSQKYKDGIIYGDVLYCFDGNNEVYVKAKSLKYFWKGMPFVHQTTFVTTDLMKEFPFDTKYKLIADYSSLYRIYLSGADFHYINLPLCNYLAGGLSDNNPKTIIECTKMLFPIHQDLNIRTFYYYRYVECIIKYNFAKCIGQSNYAFIRRLKSKLIGVL